MKQKEERARRLVIMREQSQPYLEPPRFKEIRLIKAMPEEGGTIIVMVNRMGRHMKEGATVLRGKEFARKVRVVSIRNVDDTRKIMGLSGYIVCHHVFSECAKPELRERVEQIVSGIMSMRPSAPTASAP